MTAETLRCSVCQREVRIVRLGRQTLALGHTTNPRNGRHPVQLARSGVGSREDARRQSEVPERHGIGSSSQSANGTRPARDGRSRTASPSGTIRALRGTRVDGGTPPASSRSAERSTLT